MISIGRKCASSDKAIPSGLRQSARAPRLEQILPGEYADNPVCLPIDDRYTPDAGFDDQIRNNAAWRVRIGDRLRDIRDGFGKRHSDPGVVGLPP